MKSILVYQEVMIKVYVFTFYLLGLCLMFIITTRAISLRYYNLYWPFPQFVNLFPLSSYSIYTKRTLGGPNLAIGSSPHTHRLSFQMIKNFSFKICLFYCKNTKWRNGHCAVSYPNFRRAWDVNMSWHGVRGDWDFPNFVWISNLNQTSSRIFHRYPPQKWMKWSSSRQRIAMQHLSVVRHIFGEFCSVFWNKNRVTSPWFRLRTPHVVGRFVV